MASHLTEKESHRNIEQKRFAFIELMLIWEGSIKSMHVAQQFELHEKLAAQIIKQYKNLYPANIEFNAALAGYVVTDAMVAQYSSGSLHEYVKLIASEHMVTELAMPSRNIQPNLIRPILQAIREQRRLSIEYASVNRAQFSPRIIQPHNLIFDGLRWHVRAYCEKNQAYRDFVLSRFNPMQASELLDGSDHFDLQDEAWQTLLDVEIIPDPRLSQDKQGIIALDFDMDHGPQGFHKKMKVRSALLLYFVKRLGLDHYHNKPEAQQIILSPSSAEALKPYLPQ